MPYKEPEKIPTIENGIEALPYPKTVNKLYRFPLTLSTEKCNPLVDTGSVASFISADFLADLVPNGVNYANKPNQNRPIQFKSASGTPIEPLGYFSIPLTIKDDLKSRHPFYIVPYLQEECILGMDFMKTHRMKINVAKKEVSVSKNGKKVKIALTDEEHPVFSIKENEDGKLKNLSEKDQDTILKVLEKHDGIFAEKINELGRTNIVRHEVRTTGEPFALKHYKTPITLRPLVKQHIKEMLKYQIIRPSNGPYRSPVLMVKKKTGDLRFCVDYRRLNKQTIKDKYPLPRIDDTLDFLHGAKYFSTIDLLSGYWQIEIEEEDKYKTAFTTEFGHYEFNRMPFGLCNAPGTFQRLMESILQPILGEYALVYIDDVIVYSKTIEEHAVHLEEVFKLLAAAGLKIKRSKCLFAREKVNYLGHVVSAKGVAPDKKKIKAIEKFPTPTNVDQVRSFVGLASYYRRFIRNFAEKAHALTNLTRKSVAWKWGPDEQSAFDSIRKCLMTKPILRYPDFAKEFIIHTDASGYGIGAVLSQIQSSPITHGTDESETEEREVVIAYTSKHLNDAQAKWSTTEKEAYAIVHAVKTFQHYLYGTNFTVVTDHRPLEYMMSKKEPSGRLARWSLFLQPFNLGITYRPGKSNQNADCLSRAPVNVITANTFEVTDWLQAQKEDVFCDTVIKEIDNATEPRKKIS